jgi:hypothetical protein
MTAEAPSFPQKTFFVHYELLLRLSPHLASARRQIFIKTPFREVLPYKRSTNVFFPHRESGGKCRFDLHTPPRMHLFTNPETLNYAIPTYN